MNISFIRFVFILACFFSIILPMVACSPKAYVYRSVENSELIRAMVRIPTDDNSDPLKKSSIQIQILGFTTDKDSKKHLLAVRFYLDNQSKKDWDLPLSQYQVAIPNRQSKSAQQENPLKKVRELRSKESEMLIVYPGPASIQDLYFELPNDIQTIEDLPECTVSGVLKLPKKELPYSVHFRLSKLRSDEPSGSALMWDEYHEKMLNGQDARNPHPMRNPYKQIRPPAKPGNEWP